MTGPAGRPRRRVLRARSRLSRCKNDNDNTVTPVRVSNKHARPHSDPPSGASPVIFKMLT